MKCHRLDGVKTRETYQFTRLENRRSRSSRVQFSVRTVFLVCRYLPSLSVLVRPFLLVCREQEWDRKPEGERERKSSHEREKEIASLLELFIVFSWTLILLDQGPTHMNSFNLNWFLRVPSPDIATLRIRAFQHENIRGTQTLSP